MRKLINLISIYRYYRKPELITKPEYSIKKLIELGKKCTYKSFDYKVHLVLIKKIRSTYPYKVLDYSKAKEKYENYFKIENAIPSYENFIELIITKKEIFITRFSEDEPYRGNRYCEYYSNYNFIKNKLTFKVKNIFDDYIELISVNGDTNNWGLNKNNFTAYRFSFDDEIIKFKNAEKLVIEVQSKIDATEKELSNLYSMKDSIIKLDFE